MHELRTLVVPLRYKGGSVLSRIHLLQPKPWLNVAFTHGRSDKDDTDGPTSANSEDLVVDEAPQSAGEEREAGLDTKRRGSPSRDASGLHDDPKLARLETEAAAAAESDDGVGFADLRQRRAAAEAARGLGVRKQRAMWERLLELRILLQVWLLGCQLLIGMTYTLTRLHFLCK